LPRIAGALLTQTTAFCSLDVLSLDRSARSPFSFSILGGTGYLYGGLIGAVIYKFLPGLGSRASRRQYWQFWIGLVLGGDRADRARRHQRLERGAA